MQQGPAPFFTQPTSVMRATTASYAILASLTRVSPSVTSLSASVSLSSCRCKCHSFTIVSSLLPPFPSYHSSLELPPTGHTHAHPTEPMGKHPGRMLQGSSLQMPSTAPYQWSRNIQYVAAAAPSSLPTLSQPSHPTFIPGVPLSLASLTLRLSSSLLACEGGVGKGTRACEKEDAVTGRGKEAPQGPSWQASQGLQASPAPSHAAP